LDVANHRTIVDARIRYKSVNPRGNHTDFLMVNHASDLGVHSSNNSVALDTRPRRSGVRASTATGD
jgi:hypothetical protein